MAFDYSIWQLHITNILIRIGQHHSGKLFIDLMMYPSSDQKTARSVVAVMHAHVFGEQASSATPIFLQRAQAAYERHAEIICRPARWRSYPACALNAYAARAR